MLREFPPDVLCGEFGIVRDQSENHRETSLADTPHVEVSDARRSGPFRMCLDRFAHLCNDRVIHLAVEQDARGIARQSPGPDGDEHGADDAHRGVEPIPSEPCAAGQCGDGEDRGRGVGQHMHVG